MRIRPLILAFTAVALTALAASVHPQSTANTPDQPPASVPQADPIQTMPGGVVTQNRTNEPTLDALTHNGPDAIALKLRAGKSLMIHNFDFNGEPVPAAKIHLRQLAPGVFELTSLAYAPGIWRFHLTDAASYFGLGEHFDTLDHAHTILRNISLDVAAPRGSTALRPVPLFFSTSGYALYLDLARDPASPGATPEATFDFNASDPSEITIDAATERLRILLCTGDPNTPGRFPDLQTQMLARRPQSPAPRAGSAYPVPLAEAVTAALSASLSGLHPAPIPAPEPGDAPAARYVEFAAFDESVFPAANGADPALYARYQAISKSLQVYKLAGDAAHRPVLRPLVLDFQDDPEARETKDEYLLGPDILVAPVLDANTSRLVYLPAGDWRNLATDEKFTGPLHLLVAAPLDTIPLFARPDATLPDLHLAPPAKPAP